MSEILLNKNAYLNILYQDLDWLKNQKQSSERDHIIQIIENLISNASRI